MVEGGRGEGGDLGKMNQVFRYVHDSRPAPFCKIRSIAPYISCFSAFGGGPRDS